MSEQTDDKINYSSAIMTLIDRDSGEKKRVMAYPIVQIDLMCLDEINGVRPQKCFVARNGRWEEVQ